MADTTGFDIGDLVTGTLEGRTVQAVVLDKAEGEGRLLLMTIPEGAVSDVAETDVASWSRLPSPQARWVEVYEPQSQTPFFAAYVPDIAAAVAVYRAFEARDGDFRVEIYTTEDGENEMLDSIGYFGNAG